MHMLHQLHDSWKRKSKHFAFDAPTFFYLQSSGPAVNGITREFYRQIPRPSPVGWRKHYHHINRTTERKEEEEREEELVQPGPRQSSDGSCPTDAAFGEMRRRRKGKKAEKER
ncbi:PREDICTED: uncharacterized protein LOC108759889 [Trachymyrmex cornetzi]|uniref:uncharacterized protein LOC108759889 n=1 Tax=Trachymyrmex cornetzi TaxID=471704 RepID=UPI00084F108B|nr:PREDICTED: uncharacterized protein LOC108759889 [Trachymyrmex cornetzi]